MIEAPLLYAIPAFVVLLGAEWLAVRGRAVRGYERKDAATSLAMGFGNLVISAALKGATFGFFLWLYQFRLFDSSSKAWAWCVLMPAEDLCYYAFHRTSHEVRLFWAAHENHHSSRYFNLSTALRQSWTTPLLGPIFWSPLPLLGFHPTMILTLQAVSLLYQFWIHTELIGRLGPLEWVLNTPSHHRVHHGRNVEYLDRNYAGILILWDRLFGSFEPEVAPVDYGLTKNIESFNPVVVAFHEWAAMFRDARRAGSARDAVATLLRPPGWSRDGRSSTAREMQARLARGPGAPAH